MYIYRLLTIVWSLYNMVSDHPILALPTEIPRKDNSLDERLRHGHSRLERGRTSGGNEFNQTIQTIGTNNTNKIASLSTNEAKSNETGNLQPFPKAIQQTPQKSTLEPGVLEQSDGQTAFNNTKMRMPTVEPNSATNDYQPDVSDTPACPGGFIRHKNSCYHIIGSSELTWPIANTYCQLHNSKLVEIDTESEQRFVDSMIKAANDGDAYWIGATNRMGKGNWRWESSSQPLTSFNMWVTEWSDWVDEIESPSCALIDTSESNQWMFWPCEKNFYMTGKKHNTKTGVGLICEKESPRAPRKTRHGKLKKRRRQRRKGRRNWQRRQKKRLL